MMEKTKELIIKYILPTLETMCRQHEHYKMCDRDSIRVAKIAITQINDYIVGMIDSVSWDSIRFFKESIIPIASYVIYLDGKCYDPTDPKKWDECIDDMKKVPDELVKTKKRTAPIGCARHFNMFGIVISKERN